VKHTAVGVAIDRQAGSGRTGDRDALVDEQSPLVKPIVPVTAKLIVSPSFASASAWRNEPAPLSLVLVTVIVSART
jgi:hypothetical protein